MRAPWALTATETAAHVRNGTISPVEVVESLLDRVEAVEPSVQAWVLLDRDGALRQAQRIERDLRSGKPVGPLAGIALGVKDIFDVRGLPTLAGSRSTSALPATGDSAPVSRWRRAGGIVLGKLQTCEFADADPSGTRNAWSTDHTPGGSSSGSGAAVAAGMIPIALGSQTGGSTLRPAAYNGVVGFKPTFGVISGYGMIPHSSSLDTVGIIARSVADVVLAVECLAGFDARDPGSLRRPQRFDADEVRRPLSHPRVALLGRYFLDRCEVETRREAEKIVDLLSDAGAVIKEVTLPDSFAEALQEYKIVGGAELAAYHEEAFSERGQLYGPKVASRIREGLGITATRYLRAMRRRSDMARELRQALKGYDAALTPATPAPAPRDLSTTGDPSFQQPWSFCGFPAIALPSGLLPVGLPVGVQLVAVPAADARLLRVAVWCEQVIAFKDHPASWVSMAPSATERSRVRVPG